MASPRFVLRFLAAFVARFRLVIIASLALGVGMFFLFTNFGLPFFQKGHERIGVAGRYRPDNLPDFILEMLSRGLTSVDETGTVVPALATSWETPDKGRTWTFKLGEGFWQDGRAIKSSDISYEFSDVTIERPEDKTIVFKLENPFTPFPSVVSRPVFRQGLLGVGDWEVSKIRLSGTYVSSLEIKDKKGNKKDYKFYPTEERAKLAFKLGEVDVLEGVFSPSPFDGWGVVDVTESTDIHKAAVVFLNTSDKFLSEKNLRQALYYAVDKEEFGGARSLSPIAPDSWAYNPQVKPYNFDPERAKELIEELPDEVKQELSIKLVAPPLLLAQAEKIASHWKDVGVTTFVQVSSGIPSEYQALLAIYDIPSDPDQYALWHSTQEATNISKLKNPRIDALLESGRSELSLEERKNIYLDFQRFLLEEAPAIFLYYPVTYTISRR
jgi:peptide/nickel transport system substrate-binding protein